MSDSRNPCWNRLNDIECSKLAIAASDVVTVHADDTIEEIVKALHKHKLLCVPVLKDDDTLLGMLDLHDMVAFLASSVVRSSSTTHHDVRARTANEILLLSTHKAFAPLRPQDKCSKAVNYFADSCHVCLIKDADNRLVGLLTQLDMATELTTAMRDDASCSMVGKLTLQQLEIGQVPPITISTTRHVRHAIALLEAHHISALAVVDDHGRLVGNFSLTNLVALWLSDENVNGDPDQSIETYLKKHSISSLWPVTTKRTESLVDVMSRMTDDQVHRLWIVDDDGKPSGVVSMTDLFQIVRDARGGKIRTERDVDTAG